MILFSAARAHLVNLDRVIQHPPDLCVEVVSDSTASTDRGRKMQMFARYRVGEYWIVDPATRAIEVHGLTGEGYTLVDTVSGDAVIPSPTLGDCPVRVATPFP